MVDLDSGLFKRIELMIRLSIPHIFLITLFVLNIVSWHLPGAFLHKPFLFLMGIYYWSIYRPTLIPPLFCLAAGLTFDALTGAPLGLYAFLFTFINFTVSRQRRFLIGQTYVVNWLVFGLICVFYSILEYIFIGWKGLSFRATFPILLNAGFSFFLFPVMTYCFVLTHRFTPTQL